jgi:hypothetical protein
VIGAFQTLREPFSPGIQRIKFIIMSSGRDPQVALHDRTAEVDMEPTREWAARHRPPNQDNKKSRNTPNILVKEGKPSKRKGSVRHL